jgi:hypothetical protein
MMKNYIAFQQFNPEEHQNDKRCIWCGKEYPHNKSHIISRKLTLTSHHSAILEYSVCQNCNSKCGQLENWVLRNSPLGWTRFFFYLSSNKDSNTGTIPSYFWDEDQHEWIIYSLEGRKRVKTIDCQFILKQNGQLMLVTERPGTQLNILLGTIGTNTHILDIRPSLPDDFSPRALISHDKVIVIARSQEATSLFIQKITNSEISEESKNRKRLKSSPQNRQHFRWSRENWIKLCAKISYETLCLFEGSEYCLKSDFDRVRTYVLSGVSEHYHEIVFDEHGPLCSQDIPNTYGGIDITNDQHAPENFVALLPFISPGMHSVNLYEIDGWIYSSISIAGFPACCLVLGGPNMHLRDMYTLIYDNQTDDFHTVCLAYDPNKPAIPIFIEGNMSESLVRTYKLRSNFIK